jgi:glycosyltransferase involved in cell wall biosynthesis
MASNLAVIMTDVGLADEVVHDGVNGRVVPVADFTALSYAMIDLCEQPEKRRTLAQAGKETVMRLRPRTYEEYLAAWKKSFQL